MNPAFEHVRHTYGAQGDSYPVSFGNTPIGFRFLHSKILTEMALSPCTRVKINAYELEGTIDQACKTFDCCFCLFALQ